MPRRVYTYPADRGWDTLNLVTTLGVPDPGAGGALFRQLVYSLRRGAPAATTPGSLDASNGPRSSPPPRTTLPPATDPSRRPLWDASIRRPGRTP